MTVIVLNNRLIDIFRTLGMSELENYFRLRNQGEKLLGSRPSLRKSVWRVARRWSWRLREFIEPTSLRTSFLGGSPAHGSSQIASKKAMLQLQCTAGTRCARCEAWVCTSDRHPHLRRRKCSIWMFIFVSSLISCLQVLAQCLTVSQNLSV